MTLGLIAFFLESARNKIDGNWTKKKPQMGPFLFFAEFRKFFIEFINSTCGINEFQFTGKERV